MATKTTKPAKPKPVKDINQIVGMWAFILEGDKIKRTVFIYGKAGNDIFIVQAINALSGSPNVARLVHISNMMDWLFIPDKAVYDEVMHEYDKRQVLKHKFDLSVKPQ